MSLSYSFLKKITLNIKSPASFVDLNAFDQNIKMTFDFLKSKNKKLRIATKSIRVPDLIKRIIEYSPNDVSGLMTYSIDETEYLSKMFPKLNFLVAYPIILDSDINKALDLLESNVDIVLMVDSIEHLNKLKELNSKRDIPQKIKVCVDVDMGLKPFWGIPTIGVLRSPINSLDKINNIINNIKENKQFSLCGIMGYEAQIAGLQDNNPFNKILNPIKRIIRKLSIQDVANKRERIDKLLKDKKINIQFFNGGGTGSIFSTSKENCITEITIGSGFLCPHLFDYYSDKFGYRPALFFSIPVTRVPKKNIITCKGGGFMASGQIGPDKAPVPFSPKNIAITHNEGFGEVQTPIKYDQVSCPINIGDPLFFRPSKAGELTHFFNEYHLINSNGSIAKSSTYRGHGQDFH